MSYWAFVKIMYAHWLKAMTPTEDTTIILSAFT